MYNWSPQRREERRNRKTIWKNNVQKFPKFGENYKIRAPSNSTNIKKPKENNRKAYHNEITWRALLDKFSKVLYDSEYIF